MSKELPIIGLDTEYFEYNPFVATTCDERLEPALYELANKKEYRKLKKLSESGNIIKVFHAACNDIYALKRAGIEVVPPYEDTMIAAALLNENFESKRLKSLAKIYLDEACDEERELSKVKAKLKREAKKVGKEFSYQDIPPHILYPYAKKDPEYNIKLWYLFKGPLKRYQKIYELEKQLIPIIVEMVDRGMKIDRKFVKDVIKRNEKEVRKAKHEMHAILADNRIRFLKPVRREIKRNYDATLKSVCNIAAKAGMKVLCDNINVVGTGEDEKWYIDAIYQEKYNPNSIAHIRKILKMLKVPVTLLTDDWELSTESRALEPLKDEVPFIYWLLRYRFLTKQLTTYYRPLYNRFTKPGDPYAHFMLYQSGAKTGRFSANLIQTIPRNEESKVAKEANQVRKAFIPRKGYRFAFIDYDQIEMRLFAHYSKCTLLIDAINNGYDPHLGTAVTLFGEEVVLANGDDIKKLCRNVAKTINFGIIYGMGVRKLTASLEPIIRHLKEKLKGKKVNIRSPYEILAEYHANYPVKAFSRELTSHLYKAGSIEIKFNSELMKFSREYRVPQRLAYKGPNMVIQGTAAYVLKAGMLRAYEYIQKSGKDIHMLVCVHDEIAFEVSDKLDIMEEVRNLSECMSDRVTFAVPIVASPKISATSWGDAKEAKLDYTKRKCAKCSVKVKESVEVDAKAQVFHCFECYKAAHNL